jgi:hypothetical protein
MLITHSCSGVNLVGMAGCLVFLTPQREAKGGCLAPEITSQTWLNSGIVKTGKLCAERW